MKIAIVLYTLSVGGAERVALILAKWLNSKDNNEVTIITLRHKNGATYDASGTHVVCLEEGHLISQLRNKIKEINPDIVLTMDVPMCIYTIPAMIGLRIKHVISERNDPSHFAGKWTTKILSRLLMRKADGFVFQTKGAADFYGGSISKIGTVIHNPLSDLTSYPNTTTIQRCKNIVNVGRLHYQKNQCLLIKSFAEFAKDNPDYTLTIWGDGPERENLEHLINILHLKDKVFLPGTAQNIFDKIKDASLFVLSSDFEGMPNALMEAMALGVPCISTDCPIGGPAELINNKDNGVLVPVGNQETLTMAMKEVIGDQEYAESLGANAKRIRESHDPEMICLQWLDYFHKILADF